MQVAAADLDLAVSSAVAETAASREAAFAAGPVIIAKGISSCCGIAAGGVESVVTCGYVDVTAADLDVQRLDAFVRFAYRDASTLDQSLCVSVDSVISCLDGDSRVCDVEVAVRSCPFLRISVVGYVNAVSPCRDIYLGFGKARTVVGLYAVLCCRDLKSAACDLDIILRLCCCHRWL